MTDLTKLRDELAESVFYPADRSWFTSGFDAAIKALTEAAGEFDREFAVQKIADVLLEWHVDAEILPHVSKAALSLMQAQFEQNAARIGYFRSRITECDNLNTQLEARLAESNRVAQNHHLYINDLESKLSAAEARVKELEGIKIGRENA